MNNKILVVDDESRIRKIIRDFLVREGYVVCEAEDGEAALDIFCSNNDIDLIIMDVMMPKMDGWQLCKEVRKLSKVPILMLTAKSEEQDELKGFELGVDEYISKPFSPKILTARVNALLRRTTGDNEEILDIAGITVNKIAHTVTIDGKEIDLSFKEFELLKYLAKNEGRAVAREELINQIWGYDFIGESRTLDVHINSLRKKIGSEYAHWIQSVRQVGYRFVVGDNDA